MGLVKRKTLHCGKITPVTAAARGGRKPIRESHSGRLSVGCFTVYKVASPKPNFQLKGLEVSPESVRKVQGGLLLAPAHSTGLAAPGPQQVPPSPLQGPHRALRPHCLRPLTSTYLHVDFLPGLVGELAAALLLQLLQDAAVHGQAVVDFCKELVYVRAEGTQDAVTDLCELRT